MCPHAPFAFTVESRFSTAASAVLFFTIIVIALCVSSPATPAAPAAIATDTMYVQGHFGGWVGRGCVDGNRAFIARGATFVVLDISGAVPARVGLYSFPDGQEPQHIIVRGAAAYVICSNSTLYVMDITDPAAPTVVSQLPIDGLTDFPFITGMTLRGSSLFVSCETNGYRIIDVQDPAHPVRKFTGPLNSRNCAVAGAHAFHIVPVTPTGPATELVVHDVTNETAPVEVARVALPDEAQCIAIEGTVAYVTSLHGFVAVNLVAPAAPVVGPVIDATRRFKELATSPTHLYLGTDQLTGTDETVFAYALANPLAPALAGWKDVQTSIFSMSCATSRVYIATGAGFDRIDFSTPANPVFEPGLTEPSMVTGMAKSGTTLLLTDASGILRYDATDPAAPMLTHVWQQFPDRTRPILRGTTLYTINELTRDVEIIDVANPAAPALRASVHTTEGDAREIAVGGTRLYVGGTQPDNIEIIDVSNPAAPVKQGRLPLSGEPRDIAIQDTGSVLAVACYSAAHGILSLTNVANPLAPAGIMDILVTGLPITLAIDRANLHFGYNDEAAGTYFVNTYDFRNPLMWQMSAQFTGAGTIRDIEVVDNEMLLSLSSGDVLNVLYTGPGSTLAPGSAGRRGGYTVKSGIRLAGASDAVMAHMQNHMLIAYLLAGYCIYSPYKLVKGSEGVYVITTKPSKPPVTYELLMRIQPPQAQTDGCATNPSPGLHAYNEGSIVGLVANANTSKSWNFKEWTGDANGTNPLTSITMDRNKTATANFVQPILTLSGGTGEKVFCPTCDSCTAIVDTILAFKLCASADDDWTVTGLEFESSGTGDDKADLLYASLFCEGQYVADRSFPTDNGKIRFSLNRLIPKNNCRTFQVVYAFANKNSVPPGVKTYSLAITSAQVDAVPMHYAVGVKLPAPNTPVVGGPIILGPVFNTKTRVAYQTISAAVGDAMTNDVIMVCPGSYKENVVINQALTVQSTKGPLMTLVTAADTAKPVFMVGGSGSTLQGLTITGGISGIQVHSGDRTVRNFTIHDCMITNNARGIDIDGAENLTVDKHTIIESNKAEGIFVSRCERGTFSDLLITNNRGGGGGISASSRLLFYGCRLENNVPNGLTIGGSEYLSISHSTIQENPNYGIHLVSGGSLSLDLDACAINGNRSGGIVVDNASTVLITSSTFSGNSAYDGSTNDDNGIIRISNVESSCIVSGNTIETNDGTGIIVENTDGLVVSGNVIKSNKRHGLSIGGNSRAAKVNNNLIQRHPDGYRAVSITGAADGKMTDCTISNNSSGVYAFDATGWRFSSMTIRDNLPKDNAASIGCGMMLQQSRDIGITGSTISGNVFGVWMNDSRNIGITNNTLWRNRKAAITAENSSYTAAGNSIWFNGLPFKKGGDAAIANTRANAVIRGNAIAGTIGDGMLFVDQSTGFVRGNLIQGNSSAGLRNIDNAVTIDARGNWWGDLTGPGGEGPGAGDEVFGAVDYSPWLPAPSLLVCTPGRDSLFIEPGMTDSLVIVLKNLAQVRDSVELLFTDERGWLEPPVPRFVALPDSAGAEALLRISVPGNEADGATSTIRIAVHSLLDPAGADSAAVVVAVVTPVLHAIEPLVDTLRLRPGGKGYLHARGIDQRGGLIDFTPVWTATGGSVDTAAMYTAGTQAGTFNATVRDTASGLSASMTIVIDGGPPVMTRVFIRPALVTVAVGGSVALHLFGRDQFGMVHRLDALWTPAGGAMAGDTYHAGPAPGTYEVTADDGAGHVARGTVTVVPEGFALLAPPDGAVGQPVNIALAWQPHPLAMAYRVQVARDAGFADMVIDDSLTPGPDYACTVVSEARHYWRVFVRALRDTVIVSPVWSFTTAMAHPSLVTLRSPVDGSTGLPLTMDCTWDAHPGFSRYKCTLALDPAMTNVVRCDSGMTSGSCTHADLPHNTVYHWRVDATTTTGETVSSPVWSFATVDTTSVGVDATPRVRDFTILGNHPNPFSGSTVITYALPVDADIRLEVRALTGATIATHERRGEGRGLHHVEWNAAGHPSGTYLVVITAVPVNGGPTRRAVLRATVLH